MLHPHRLFPADPASRAIAVRLYTGVKDLPILSPHGHTDARWFAENEPFPDPATLLIQPDHYIFRMLYSQGVQLERMGIGQHPIADPRSVWRLFAKNYYLFRGTPTRLWLDYAFEELFGLTTRLSEATADTFYDAIQEKLAMPEFRPRALYERFQSRNEGEFANKVLSAMRSAFGGHNEKPESKPPPQPGPQSETSQETHPDG